MLPIPTYGKRIVDIHKSCLKIYAHSIEPNPINESAITIIVLNCCVSITKIFSRQNFATKNFI